MILAKFPFAVPAIRFIRTRFTRTLSTSTQCTLSLCACALFIGSMLGRAAAAVSHTRRIPAMLLTLLLSVTVITPGIGYASMEIQELDGDIVRLEERVGGGKWLLVMLWATDCHICKQQKPEMSRFHDKHKDTDAEVLGIALDGMGAVDEVKSYLEHHKPSFPNYVGEIAIVASHYLVLTEESLRGTPTYLLFNPDGELVGNNPGPLSVEALEQFISKKSEG